MQKRVILRAFSTLTILCLYLCKKTYFDSNDLEKSLPRVVVFLF
jgi:hypothetical protein